MDGGTCWTDEGSCCWLLGKMPFTALSFSNVKTAVENRWKAMQ